jgi:hypothetical protein
MQEHEPDALRAVSPLRLTEPLTIRRADEISKALLEALDATDALTLALPDEGAVDLSFVQIVEAARIEAQRLGKTIALEAPAAGSLHKLLQDAGFLATPATSTFWLTSGASR